MLSNGHDEKLRSTLVGALARRMAAAGRGAAGIDERSRLLDLGLIDSEDLIEIILEVEEQCECEFNPQQMDFENGLTLGSFIASFVART